MSEPIDAYENRPDCVQDAWVEVSAAAGFYRMDHWAFVKHFLGNFNKYMDDFGKYQTRITQDVQVFTVSLMVALSVIWLVLFSVEFYNTHGQILAVPGQGLPQCRGALTPMLQSQFGNGFQDCPDVGMRSVPVCMSGISH
jgi:hypothetical protein